LEECQVLVQRDDVSVMFKRVADEPNEIVRGMAEVEEIVGLRGRKYSGEPPGIYELIGPTFKRLSGRPDRESRPGIEFYRRHDVIDLLLPVL
jgi:hypothetical protein